MGSAERKLAAMDAAAATNGSAAATDDDVRREVRALLEERGLSISAAAGSIGRSAATLSLWLRGTYDGDSAAVARLARRWVRSEREIDRAAVLADVHVALAVTEEVEALARHARAAGDIAVIHGAAGAGKTWALARYCLDTSDCWLATMSPAVTTPAGALGRIAAALGVAPGGSAARTEAIVVERLARGRRPLLVVDEAHHLAAPLLDEIRCVHDAARCGLVLAGNEPLWGRLTGGVRAAQIVSRVGVRRLLGAPSTADAEDLAAALLGSRPRGAGLRAVLDAAARPGGLRSVRKLAASAAVLARGAGRDVVVDGDLADAAELAGLAE